MNMVWPANSTNIKYMRNGLQVSAILIASLLLSGCAYLSAAHYSLLAETIYSTDPEINYFTIDDDCCLRTPDDPQSIFHTIPAAFPIGSCSSNLTSYVEGWGGNCTILDSGGVCEITISIYGPSLISLSTVGRRTYQIEWTGADRILSYIDIERAPGFLGHIDQDQWDREVELQREMIRRNMEIGDN